MAKISRTKKATPGMRDVAREAGVSVATVSRALRQGAYLSNEKRDAVYEAARRLGYEFNPLVGQMMSALRGRTGRDFVGNLALLWYDTSFAEEHPWRKAIIKSARERAGELGYSVDEFERQRYTPKQLAKILQSRGVEGVIISPPEKSLGKVHMKVPLEPFCWVSMGWSLYSPAFHSVRFDHFQAVRLAVHYARRKYGPAFAALFDLRYDRRSDGSFRGGFLAHHPAGPHKANGLIFDLNALDLKKMRRMYEKGAFRGLISQARMQLPAGLASWFPAKDILFLDEPEPTQAYGYIDYQHNVMARWTVDILVSAIQRREKGIPPTAMTIHVPPRWIPG